MKRIIAILVVLFILCSTTACGGQGETNATEKQNTKATTEAENKNTTTAATMSEETEEATQLETETVETTEESTEEATSGIRPEFKETMDAYEAFYDEYCAFMEKYKQNPSDLSLLAEYATMVGKMADMNAAFEKWDQDEMTTEELKYYLEVSSRVAQKMVDAAT